LAENQNSKDLSAPACADTADRCNAQAGLYMIIKEKISAFQPVGLTGRRG